MSRSGAITNPQIQMHQCSCPCPCPCQRSTLRCKSVVARQFERPDLLSSEWDLFPLVRSQRDEADSSGGREEEAELRLSWGVGRLFLLLRAWKYKVISEVLNKQAWLTVHQSQGQYLWRYLRAQLCSRAQRRWLLAGIEPANVLMSHCIDHLAPS